MKWELERHNWDEMAGGSDRLPGWIEELIGAENTDEARRLLGRIESVVAPVNGPLRFGASAVAACLTQGLLSATSFARVEILYLIFQLAGGAIGAPDSKLASDVRREIELGLPIFCEIAETGTQPERLQCIDLLSLCARFNEAAMSRAVWVMRQIANLGEEESTAVAVELDDLGKA